jgi:diguanylate cyclase (GGDEF)-like protein/PAS domain S-box-containing protein
MPNERGDLPSPPETEQERLLRLVADAAPVLDSIPFSVLVTDAAGRIVSMNAAAERLLGYRSAELLGDSLASIDAELGASKAGYDRVLNAALDTERERAYRRKDGELVPVSEAVTLLHGGAPDVRPAGYLVVAYDITQRKQAQAAEVEFLETHDPLTKLPTRGQLLRQLGEAIVAAQQDGTEVAVLVVDLDHLKRVNDALGLPAGDELLVRIAERLRSWVRTSDVVARLGGDEFAIVLSGLQQAESITSRVDVLLEDLLTTVTIGGHPLPVTVSIGGAVHPPGSPDPAELIKRADLAMEHAKASGRNNFQWFRDDMVDAGDDALTVASALRQTLRDGGLSIAYQAQVDVRTGRVVGIEALARWTHPDLGEVPPTRFIPIAEDGGMIVQLGGWILRKACRDVASIQRALGRPLRVAVNVSPHQFRSTGWLGEILGALHDSGLDASQLELEITESILMDDRPDATDMLHAIRRLGVSIVVDDFGRGYSSLAYLSRLPIDKIKIDRTFVQELVAGGEHAPVVDAIIVMAHELGMTVVAEGVETAEQERYLRDRGCDEMQGFYYSRGVPTEDVVRTVQQIGVF